ncbi:hypothetical protein BRADI_1g33375v3 [Brachypodium distachyon]|uniref:Uncharacterized protein n=1 Tax=Brachypodium distachyon TaxID=15368 RepID=A0A2K2DMH9_BRADI|nr:hypothetical protein BRADI_1g33375v3 [Brachypodium distachyon]
MRSTGTRQRPPPPRTRAYLPKLLQSFLFKMQAPTSIEDDSFQMEGLEVSFLLPIMRTRHPLQLGP